jgi:prolyl-tRNA synthetase
MAFNKEVFDGNESEYEMKRSIEVGNIFPFSDKNYAEKMGGFYTDKDGERKLVHFASYGIGITRLLGTLVEVNHDDKGIVWPEIVAPFAVHLIEINKSAEEVYRKLVGAGIEVLWDETDRGPGEKLGNADLLGIPVRLIVSEKTGDKIEWKRRNSEEKELLSFDEVVKRLQKRA